MLDKILKQAGICIIIVLLVLMVQSLNITFLDHGLQAVTEQVMKEYTVEDVKTIGIKAVETLKSAPAVAANIAAAVGEETEYGKPVDDLVVGPVGSVYAVSGGIVSEVGENEALGKYIKIAHGEKAESVYGNCSKITVEPLQRVKKGQIIAEFQKNGEKEFYYQLNRATQEN